MNASMATRTPKSAGVRPGEGCTDFQLHKSQLPVAVLRSVFDYTSYRLMKFIEVTSDEQQKETLRSVLKQYREGVVAVAWKSGRPVWIPVTKG
jgi:hypothetical protein